VRIRWAKNQDASFGRPQADWEKIYPTAVSLANFPEIEKYPDTPESERVGSGVRAAIISFFGSSYDLSSTWPAYFWNRGLELESCNYAAVDEDNIVK
jgi:hypothetical protein